jgi:hydrogenase-4 component F
VGVAGPAAVLVAAIALSAEVPGHGPVTAAGGLLRADALSVVMLLVIGSVALVACWAGTGYLATGNPDAGRAIRYLILVQLFIAAMSFAVLADNLGVFWVALEATTIFTAFLVGHHRDRRALEAAWKYVVLCSGGIAMAFLGTVVIYAAAVRAGGHGFDALSWTFLTAHAGQLDPGATKLAAGLLVLGFGTKAGLAPVHAWLPDAHSQAPAPVSALMSGVLLSVAFSGILRAKVVIDAAVGTGPVRWLLIAAALLSLLVAATLLLHQRDYKRMLAYSSIEHMGLVALGAAVGTKAALIAVLLHILGHGLTKTALFCSAGTVMQVAGSSKIESVRGLAATRPGLAALFGCGLFALLGLPPFSLFASELGIARAGFDANLGWAIAAAAALLLVIFVAVARHGSGMLLGPGGSGGSGGPGGSAARDGAGIDAPLPGGRSGAVPVAAALVACAALGVTLGPLQPLLDAAATVGAPR